MRVFVSRIFQSQCYSSRGGGAGISVCRPPLLDAHVRVSGARATSCDVRVDRTRLNLAAPFVLALCRALLDAAPGTLPRSSAAARDSTWLRL